MDNFVEESDRSPENPNQPKYEVSLGNIYKEPLNAFNVMYHVLKSHFDYPIQFKDEAIDRDGRKLSDSIEVFTDSKDTESKLFALNEIIIRNEIFDLLDSVGKGLIWDVIKLLNGNILRYKIYHMSVKDFTKISNPNFLPIIERCFMSSYEIRQEKFQEKPDFLLAHEELHEEIEKKHEELEEKEVKPLTPESAGGLLAPVIQKILDEHPELRPNAIEESDF